MIKMRHYYILIFLMIPSLIGYSQCVKSDKDFYNLKGNVESVHSTKYHASLDSLSQIIKGDFLNINQKDIFESKMLSNYYNSLPDNSLCQFDFNGNVRTILYFRGSITKLYMAEIRTKLNDSVNNEILYIGDDISFNFCVNVSKGLPASRQLITERNDTIVAIYTSKNCLIVKDEIFMKSQSETSCCYNYGNNKNVDMYVIRSYSKDTIMSFNYHYNIKGDLELEIRNSMNYKTQCKFDYKYDSIGNWIECYEYGDIGIESIIERKIKYY